MSRDQFIPLSPVLAPTFFVYCWAWTSGWPGFSLFEANLGDSGKFFNASSRGLGGESIDNPCHWSIIETFASNEQINNSFKVQGNFIIKLFVYRSRGYYLQNLSIPCHVDSPLDKSHTVRIRYSRSAVDCNCN